MNAREMFEQLGFEQIAPKYTHGLIAYFNKHHGRVEFHFEFKTFYIESICVDMELFKAIHQQLKELRWLDE